MSMTAFDLLQLMLPSASAAELAALKTHFQPLKRQIWQKGHYFFRQDEHFDRADSSGKCNSIKTSHNFTWRIPA